jgi:hypothetical protein
MGRLSVTREGRASRQYLVWAQRVSRRFSAARVRVIEGWRLAMREVVEAIEVSVEEPRASNFIYLSRSLAAVCQVTVGVEKV